MSVIPPRPDSGQDGQTDARVELASGDLASLDIAQRVEDMELVRDAFVQKPFTTVHLLDRVREQLDRNERPTDAPEIAHDPLHRVISDPARLAVLRGTGLLDSEREEHFDRLTRLAARLLKVPAAFISLVDEHRDFY